MRVSRGRLSFGILVLVIAAAAGGWFAASAIRSPGEAAARTAAPTASPILVPVEERVIATRIVTRGTGRFGSPISVTIPASSLKSAPGRISTLPLSGDAMAAGDVVLTASGRPVFILPGVTPMYRDLGPGLVGDDIRQLERALMDLGLNPGAVDGVYDDKTGTAVANWYQMAGWTPFKASTDQLAQIRALELDLSAATNAQLSTNDAVAVGEADLLAAQSAQEDAAGTAITRQIMVSAAQADAEAANLSATADVEAATATAATARTASVQALRMADATRLKGDVAIQDAIDALAAAEREVLVAKARVTAAERVLTTAQIRRLNDGEDAVVLAEADLLAARSALSNATDAAITREIAVRAARAEAEAANLAAEIDIAASLTVARAESILSQTTSKADANRLKAEIATQEAINAQMSAQRDVLVAESRAIAAETTLKTARTQRDAAREQTDRLAADLLAAQTRAGVQVPADEVIFVPSFPVRVERLSVTPGDLAIGPIMALTDSNLSIDGSLPLGEASLLQVGMTVTVDEPELGINTSGIVTRVASAPGTNGVDGFHVYFEVGVGDTTTPLARTSVRLTIPLESTGGAVVAVPVSALSLAADGTSRLQIENNGSLEFIEIKPGLAADGYVEVTPTVNELLPGQMVVIGFQQITSVTGG